ncbi:MAG: 50S ribosomal protein L1 [Candidatus Marinimicrobia bacterium]|nr:50S ribosomal protein L1 [Candidatus Neomarinimicrobiota bacterium]
MSLSKMYKENIEKINKDLEYSLGDSVELLKSFKVTKFDQSVDLSVNLGVDPKHADQLVRGTVSLPHGTGKSIKVLVMTNDDEKNKECLDNGADFAGFKEYVEKIEGGWFDFDVMIATPDLMVEIGKLGRFLGPRKLMPNPKSGTVTNDVVKALSEVKAGKVEFRVDKYGIVHVSVGRCSFTKDQLIDNIEVCMNAIMKSKPVSVKGTYLKKVFVSCTMSPSVKIDKSSFIK